jgi:hypothetical protein
MLATRSNSSLETLMQDQSLGTPAAAAPALETRDELGIPADLPTAFEREQLIALGWTFEPTPTGCALRKTAAGYPAKLFIVTAQRVDEARFVTHGEVTLHGLRCSTTPSVVTPAPQLFERLLFLTEATELLNLFDDSGDGDFF